jgi:colanic acid biosynthesis glycosyl transferase WcaI
MLAQIPWKPDVIICVIPTLFSALTAWVVARLSGAKAWLHIQDFELDAALSLGMLPGSKLISSAAQAFERFIFTRFDRVSTISDNMLALAVQKGVAEEKTLLFPNWVDTHRIFPIQGRNLLRKELGIPENQKVVLYHGNLGRKQGLEVLIEAAICLQDRSEILLVICGDGAARADLEGKARDMKNVRFLDLQPESRLNELVNLADVHVLPQRIGAADLVMPSKLTTMLASGKPVVACAAAGTQIWKVVDQVGKVVPPEDARALSQVIIELTNDPFECESLGKLGRNYTCQFLEKEVILAKFKLALQELLYANNRR